MSGPLRSCFAAFLLLAGLSASPASSNPFAALFNAAPGEATAPAPAEEECLLQPGKSTADGQHWVYRYDGHRKCWFQTAEGIATVKKPVHHRAAKQRAAAPKEKEPALRKRKSVVDVRAELLRSAPAETPQPTPPAPELKVVDAAPVPTTGAAALVPPAPVVAEPSNDQLTPDHPTPRQVDVETLLATAPAASDAVAASVPPATPVAVPITKAGDDGPGWTPAWLGVLLIALGLVSLLSSSRTLRGGVLAISRSGDGVGGHRGRWIPIPSFAFGRNTFDRPAAEPERSSTAVVRRLAPRAGRVDRADPKNGERIRNQVERPREFAPHSHVSAPLRASLPRSR